MQALLEEASFHKPDMEEMNEECERLLLLSAQTPVRDQAVKLSTLYTSLVAALQVSAISRFLKKAINFVPCLHDYWLFTLLPVRICH